MEDPNKVYKYFSISLLTFMASFSQKRRALGLLRYWKIINKKEFMKISKRIEPQKLRDV